MGQLTQVGSRDTRYVQLRCGYVDSAYDSTLKGERSAASHVYIKIQNPLLERDTKKS